MFLTIRRSKNVQSQMTSVTIWRDHFSAEPYWAHVYIHDASLNFSFCEGEMKITILAYQAGTGIIMGTQQKTKLI